jgi:TM2 domain-containing membrane protein YozV
MMDRDYEFELDDEEPRSPHNFIAAILLCFFFGVFGIHRFYVGKIGTGILMLLTGGGCGIWYIVDFVLIATSKFRDKDGLYLEP